MFNFNGKTMIKEEKKARFVSAEVTDNLAEWNKEHKGLNRISVLFRFVETSTGNSKLAKFLSEHKATNNDFRIIMELGSETEKSFVKQMKEVFEETEDNDLPEFVRLTASVSELTNGKFTKYTTATGEYTSIRLSYFAGEEPEDWKDALIAQWDKMKDDIELS